MNEDVLGCYCGKLEMDEQQIYIILLEAKTPAVISNWWWLVVIWGSILQCSLLMSMIG